ncbi:WD40-repeat-containing domain protein [Syncephalis pseudoplumigaleata]|uniref:WD40-repeat-containing domain protein n=1 Tax=Syncephalis pseudoplumigaleata TaxID=1712513 RepID=A0A4P9YZJ2_9FUNG|nr:WD40-repeat-containing domain protein [Syncephalis pseudoplumigaleata]|eukprot:RKP25556.1 WD40-repeat-containing domain protein [Syncephalis pseudoplumigaleata]
MNPTTMAATANASEAEASMAIGATTSMLSDAVNSNNSNSNNSNMIASFNAQSMSGMVDERHMDVNELERFMLGDAADEQGGLALANENDMELYANSGYISNLNGFLGSDAQLAVSLPAPVLRPRATLAGHTNKVVACAFSTSGRWLASAGHDKQVLLWSAPHGQLRHTLVGHAGTINTARFSPDERDLLATTSYDKTVRVWRGIHDDSDGGGPSPECAIVYHGHRGNVTAADFCPLPNGDLCYSVDAEGELHAWSISTGMRSKTIHLQSGGSSKYAAYSSNPLRSRPGSGSVVAVAQATMLMIIDVGACPDGVALITSSTGARVLSTPHQKHIGQLDWSPDGIYLVTASEDAVCVWDAVTFKPLHVQPAQTGKIASCCFVAEPIVDGGGTITSRIAFGEYESIYLWRFHDAMLTTADSQSSTSMAGGQDDGARRRRPHTPALALTTVPSGMVNCLAPLITLADDGSGTFAVCLASGSGHRDANLKLWDVLDHQQQQQS